MSQATRCTLYAETMWISPYVFSTMVALQEKQVPFDVVEVALVEWEQLKNQYRARTLTGRVPSLDHGGFSLAESSAIAEYLDEVFDEPARARLLPGKTQERARARQIMAWLRSDLGALRDERSTVTMFYPFRLKPLGAAAARDAEKLVAVSEQLIPAAGGPLFGAWHLVDSELAFMLHRLILNGHELPSRVLRWAQTEWRRPSVRAFVEHARPAEVPEGYWKFSGTPRPEAA
jgi:glutathione S-transferase